jgi:hypothetical protein
VPVNVGEAVGALLATVAFAAMMFPTLVVATRIAAWLPAPAEVVTSPVNWSVALAATAGLAVMMDSTFVVPTSVAA